MVFLRMRRNIVTKTTPTKVVLSSSVPHRYVIPHAKTEFEVNLEKGSRINGDYARVKCTCYFPVMKKSQNDLKRSENVVCLRFSTRKIRR